MSMKANRARFHIYRYQLLPFDRHFQGDLFKGMKTVDELLAHKNYFFANALRYIKTFEAGKADTATKKLLETDSFFLYRIAANRSLSRETKDFTEEELDNWPSLLVAVWNEPDKQLIAVQKRPAAFQQTDTVVRLILGSVESHLAKQQLRIHWEPLFEKKIFWDIVNRYEGKIQEIQFEIITPNMANISGYLPEDLKEFAKQTNSSINKINIESDPSSSLKIEPANRTINGLVEYSSEGGGDISVKIVGAKKKIHTSRTVKEIELEELQLHGTSDEVAEIIKGILS